MNYSLDISRKFFYFRAIAWQQATVNKYTQKILKIASQIWSDVDFLASPKEKIARKKFVAR